MGAKVIKTNITYSVVGRYMVGSKVSGYHLLGSDGSNEKVTKNQLIRLVDKGCISNCRVQMCNDCPILRGKGIDLGKLPVYDTSTQRLKVNGSITDMEGSEIDTNKVFGQLVIKAKLINCDKVIGYTVEGIDGSQKKLSIGRVLELALEGQIGNATIDNKDKPELKGIGFDIESLPSIKVKLADTNAEGLAEQVERVEQRAAKELSTISNMPNNNINNNKTCKIIDITVDELIELGKRNMELNEELTTNLRGLDRPVGIQEIKAGTARLYVQAEGKGNSKLSEFVTIAIKFGKTKGIIMRVMHRGSGQSFDVREQTLTKVNEKIALGIMCCGINKRYKNIEGFGIISVQSNDASSERVYEFR